MPRYFFHRTDGRRDVDREGTELPDLPSARVEAVRYLAETLKHNPDIVRNGEDLIVEVQNEHGLMLCTVLTTVIDAPAAGK